MTVAPNIVFEFAGLFFLYTGDPCEGVQSLPPQTKNSRYSPVSSHPI